VEFWRLYRLLRQRIWLLFLVLAVTVGIAVVKHVTEEVPFEASITLYAPPQSSVWIQELGAETKRVRTPDEVVANMAAMIMSRSVSKLTADDLQTTMTLEDYKKRVSVQRKGNTDMVEIRALGATGATAATFANTVGRVFKDYYRGEGTREAIAAVSSASDRSDTTRILLMAERERMIEFLNETDYEPVELAANNANVNVGTGTPPTVLRDAKLRVQALEAQLAEIDRLIESTPEEYTSATQLRNPVKDALQEELASLEGALEQELANRGAQHPNVKSLESHVAQMRLRLGEEPDFVEGMAQRERSSERADLLVERARISAELRGVQAQIPGLEQLATEYDAHVHALPELAEQYRALQRDIDVAQLEYDQGRQALFDAQRAQDRAGSEATIYILEDAEGDGVPVRSNLARSSVFAVFGGLLLTLVLIQGIEYLDNRVKTAEDLERLVGLPVVASIPSIEMSGAAADRATEDSVAGAT
jgi:capsular polysaccharide biosynthesis protein